MGSVNQLCNYQYQEIPEHKNFIEALNQTLCILHSTMDVAKQQSDTHNSNGWTHHKNTTFSSLFSIIWTIINVIERL